MNKIISDLAVIVSTRNREARLISLVQHLGKQDSLPALLVIVDSSENPIEQDVVLSAFGVVGVSTQVKLVTSAPGLPHQRNVGISLVRKLCPDATQICFLDDDINFESNLLSEGSSILRALDDAVCLGAFDTQWAGTNSASRFRQKNGGRILRSGIAIPSIPSKRANLVGWTPGFVMFIPAWVLERVTFRGEIRMYGEDVEFQLRASKFGKIYNSDALGIVHDYAEQGRDTYRDVQGFYDGFRWNQARFHPEVYKKLSILLHIALSVAYETYCAVSGQSKFGFEGVKGHLDFLKRLVVGEELEQKVTHYDWLLY